MKTVSRVVWSKSIFILSLRNNSRRAVFKIISRTKKYRVHLIPFKAIWRINNRTWNVQYYPIVWLKKKTTKRTKPNTPQIYSLIRIQLILTYLPTKLISQRQLLKTRKNRTRQLIHQKGKTVLVILWIFFVETKIYRILVDWISRKWHKKCSL